MLSKKHPKQNSWNRHCHFPTTTTTPWLYSVFNKNPFSQKTHLPFALYAKSNWVWWYDTIAPEMDSRKGQKKNFPFRSWDNKSFFFFFDKNEIIKVEKVKNFNF